MKKIVAISCVKNECDIIEMFCRYTTAFCDILLIHENRKSSDSTRDIINKLIKEGLPVCFEAEGEDVYFEIAKSRLAGIAIDKYGADLVVQLDADEFLFHRDGINPREALEKFDENVEYQVPWRTYVYLNEPPGDGQFEFCNFTHYRNPAFEEAQGHAGKTLASRYLLRDIKARYEYGGHWLVYPEDIQPEQTKPPVKIEVTKELMFAHYPIRNLAQTMSKAVVNYINKWQLPEEQRTPHHSIAAYQLGLLFHEIKEHGELSPDVMRDISIRYSLSNHMADKEKIAGMLQEPVDKQITEGVPDTSYCAGQLKTLYTVTGERNKEFLRAQLSVLDDVLQYLDAESRAKTPELHELINQIKDFAKERKRLQNHIEEMYQSKSWKIGTKIVRIYRFFVPRRGADNTHGTV